MFDLANMVFNRSKILSAKNMVKPLTEQIQKELVWMDNPGDPESKYLCWLDHDGSISYKSYIWLREDSFTYNMYISKVRQNSHETKTVASSTGEKSLLSCINKFIKEVAVDAAINHERKKIIKEDIQHIEKIWEKVEYPPNFAVRIERND